MHARIHNIALAAAVASSVAAVAAGCGSSNNDNSSNTQTKEKTTAQAPASTGAKGGAIKLAADPSGQLAFDKTSLSAKSGKVTIDFSNSSQVPHALSVEGKGVEKKTKTFQGGKAVLSVDLKPGKYEFYCPVDGHKQAGMKGELTVQ